MEAGDMVKLGETMVVHSIKHISSHRVAIKLQGEQQIIAGLGVRSTSPATSTCWREDPRNKPLPLRRGADSKMVTLGHLFCLNCYPEMSHRGCMVLVTGRLSICQWWMILCDCWRNSWKSAKDISTTQGAWADFRISCC